MQQQDVVIVGAGPTGLTLAAELAHRGIQALVLDKLDAGLNTSRAAVIHARTLEVLEGIGVTERLLPLGVQAKTFELRDRSKVLMAVDFSHLETKYPFMLLCPQDRTEAVLLHRLEELGGEVTRPSEVTSITPAADGVELRCTHNGEQQSIHAQWIVGCDGMHSAVRDKAGIAFEGAQYEENFVLADVRMDWPLSNKTGTAFLTDAGILLVVPLPENHFRVIALVDEAPEKPSKEDIERLLRERGPEGHALDVQEVFWSSRFHVHHRLAAAFRKGRVLIAGDAAHVHSPAGGQGMNTGIQDAVSLAEVLAGVLRGADDEALDAWATKRKSIAHGVVSTTDRMTRLGTTGSPALKALRNGMIQLAGHLPFLERAMAERLSELHNR